MPRDSDTWCVHRTPFGKEHPTCKVGIDFHQFEDNYKLMPCLGKTAEARARCPKYLAKMPEQIAAREAMITARFERIGTIRAAIIQNIKTSKVSYGNIACPCCKTGKVRYSQASNGHIHAACSTQDCAGWME